MKHPNWRTLLPAFLLFAAALLIRIFYLQQIPGFRGNEFNTSLESVGDRQIPYIGALANSIYAAGFWIPGLHYWVRGFMIALPGALTVALVYLLALRLAGIKVALLAAVMMVFCVFHIYFSSQMAWPGSLAPFLTMLFLWAFVKALQEQNGPWLVYSSFLFGIALQTHPSVIAIAPALQSIFRQQGKERVKQWLRSPWLYLTLPAAMAGLAYMIYHSAANSFQSVQTPFHRPRYAVVTHPGWVTFLESSKDAWRILLQLLSGEVAGKPLDWKSPAFLFCAGALVLGVFLCLLWRRLELPLLLLWPMSILPIVNRNYDLYNAGRYMGFLIPIGIILVAVGAVFFLEFLMRRFQRKKHLVLAVWLLLMACFVGNQIGTLSKTYAALAGHNAAALLQTR